MESISSRGYPSNLTPCNGKLFFTANDNTGYASLWVTGGTDVTTLQLGPATPVLSSARNLVSYKIRLYFQCDDGINGPEVWTSDGTVAGTVLFKDVYPGSNGSYPQHFTVANNKLFFYTYDISGIKKLFFCRLGKNLRFDFMFEWETLLPVIGFFPVN